MDTAVENGISSSCWTRLPHEVVSEVFRHIGEGVTYGPFPLSFAGRICLVCSWARRIALPSLWFFVYVEMHCVDHEMSSPSKMQLALLEVVFEGGDKVASYVRHVKVRVTPEGGSKTSYELHLFLDLCVNLTTMILNVEDHADLIVHLVSRTHIGQSGRRPIRLTLLGDISNFNDLLNSSYITSGEVPPHHRLFRVSHLYYTDAVTRLHIPSLRLLWPTLQFLAFPPCPGRHEPPFNSDMCEPKWKELASLLSDCRGMTRVVLVYPGKGMLDEQTSASQHELLSLRKVHPLLRLAWGDPVGNKYQRFNNYSLASELWIETAWEDKKDLWEYADEHTQN
jgi:hypothetical protein